MHRLQDPSIRFPTRDQQPGTKEAAASSKASPSTGPVRGRAGKRPQLAGSDHSPTSAQYPRLFSMNYSQGFKRKRTEGRGDRATLGEAPQPWAVSRCLPPMSGTLWADWRPCALGPSASLFCTASPTGASPAHHVCPGLSPAASRQGEPREESLCVVWPGPLSLSVLVGSPGPPCCHFPAAGWGTGCRLVLLTTTVGAIQHGAET